MYTKQEVLDLLEKEYNNSTEDIYNLKDKNRYYSNDYIHGRKDALAFAIKYIKRINN